MYRTSAKPKKSPPKAPSWLSQLPCKLGFHGLTVQLHANAKLDYFDNCKVTCRHCGWMVKDHGDSVRVLGDKLSLSSLLAVMKAARDAHAVRK